MDTKCSPRGGQGVHGGGGRWVEGSTTPLSLIVNLNIILDEVIHFHLVVGLMHETRFMLMCIRCYPMLMLFYTL